MLDWLLTRLRGRTPGLRDYELAVLRAYWELLPWAAQVALQEQVERLNPINRDPWGSVVTCYIPGAPLQGHLLLRNNRPVLYAAAVDCFRSGLEGKCFIKICVGQLSRLEFRGDPGWRPGKGLRTGRVNVLNDVTRIDDTAWLEPDASTAHLPRWVESDGPVMDLCGPAPEAAQKAFVALPQVPPPGDLVDLLVLTDGFAANGWIFEGTRFQEILGTDETLIPVAYSDDQTGEPPRALCLSCWPADGGIVLCNRSYGEVEERFESMEEAWRHVMRMPREVVV